MVRGLSLLREGRYFEAHECFEEVWHSSLAEQRTLMHALAQLSASYHQLALGRARAAVRTWLKACDKLAAIDALSSDYRRSVEAFWLRLEITSEAPGSIRVESLPAPEGWPIPEYLLALVAAR